MSLIGILNVNKPAGCTSRRVVDHVERIVRPAKTGHAGTLDPLATGVLVVCVGQATRLIQYVQRMAKTYRATFLLGHQSATDDIEGEVRIVADVPMLALETIAQVLPRFTGTIQQTPPAHSAVKIAGRRAYKLARAGKKVEIAARPVTIHRLSIRRYEYPELELEIECSSGTYVRSLGRDLATELGTVAVMSALERTAIGDFQLEDAVELQQLTPETCNQYLQPALRAVADLPRLAVSETQQVELQHGRPISVYSAQLDIHRQNPAYRFAAIRNDQLVAIVVARNAQLWPEINFPGQA